MIGTVLLVDDDLDALSSLERVLQVSFKDIHFHQASNSEQAQLLTKRHQPEVAILDLNLDERIGNESGFSTLKQILTLESTCRVIVLTGQGGKEEGIRALQLGASSFLQKPADITHLTALIRDGLETSRLRKYARIYLQERSENLNGLIVGESAIMQSVRKKIEYATASSQPVLITGETGTGKGLCALAVHRFGSRNLKQFIRYQPNFQTADLVNSELFGHTKGAFTGAVDHRKGLLAEAHEGTLFLDEIDELPLETQVTLLGVLQEKQFRKVGSNELHSSSFRFICALNGDIEECVRIGKIRKDFYHRVNHLEIHLPPLRDRREDIPLLVTNTLRHLHIRGETTVLEVDSLVMNRFIAFDWPGNIRQLEAVVEGAAYHAQFHGRSFMNEEDISLKGVRGSPTSSFHDQVERYKIQLIQEALSQHGGNQVKASQALGMDRISMRRILARNSA